jgi:hypothetical protein
MAQLPGLQRSPGTPSDRVAIRLTFPNLHFPPNPPSAFPHCKTYPYKTFGPFDKCWPLGRKTDVFEQLPWPLRKNKAFSHKMVLKWLNSLGL